MKKNAIIGLGGFGCNFNRFFDKNSTTNFSFFCMDDNEEMKSKLQNDESITFILDNKELLDNITNLDKVFVVVGLGGEFGSGKVLELLELFKTNHVSFEILATKPFSWEPASRKEQAELLEKKLERENISLSVFGNAELQSFFSTRYPNAKTLDFFNHIDHYFKDIILERSFQLN